MEQDLLPYLERQFSAITQQFATVNERLDSVDHRLDSVDHRLAALETDVRRAYVLVEDVQDQVRLVAEGVAGCNEQLKQQRVDLMQRIDVVESFNRRSYEDLDLRVRKLERTA